MFNWFKKKSITPTIAKNDGYFSTDIDFRRSNRHELSQQLLKTFQQPLPEKPADGTAMDGWDDGYSSKQSFNVGGIVPTTQIGWYASWGFIGYQAAALISQHWLVDKACTMPARDAMRHGYELAVNDGSEVGPEILSEIKRMDKKFSIRREAVEFVRKGRIFGVRIALFNIRSSDPEYYEKPFNIDGITKGSYRGITQVDPYWIAPILDGQSASNPAYEHFYEPTWWMINGKKYHRSHLIIFRNGDLPDVLKPSYIYGGIPVPQKIAERIYAAERTANEAPMLALSKRTTVMYLDVEAALANQATFDAKMIEWTRLRDNYGVKVVGNAEKLEQFDTSLSELDAVIMTQYQLVAAAAGVPATKLLGTSPKGFDSAGQQEQDSYHEELETIQSNDMSALIERHHEILMRSHICPKFKIKPFEIELAWSPVDSPNAKEQAEINKIKADTAAVLSGVGAIDGEDERQRITSDKDSGYNGLSDIIPDQPSDPQESDEA